MLNKKHNQNQENTKIRKRDFKEKTRQETKQLHRIDKKKKNIFAIESFDVVIFMKQKQRR